MLFNSYSFIFIFLPSVFAGFFALARYSTAYAAAWLALASLIFYGYWNPLYVSLLLGSIVFNYLCGMGIARAETGGAVSLRKRLLFLAITANLALLAYYKYANFFLDSLNTLSGSHWLASSIVLPLGISFFTFTQIAYLVDTSQGKVKEYNFVHYVLFVTFFPHLIAGPVLHHKDMMPQFAHHATYRINWNNLANGWMLFVLGLCKKVLWADSFAVYANTLFDGVLHDASTLPTMYEAWSGALAYTMQIYFDFSGYSDMALGIALMFNIRLPVNFSSPYQSTSITEFWRRWHISLSTFLRDYLYIPLGGNRHGALRRYINLFLTMLLGGLWHGAGWTYVAWGALHGIYLALNHLWRALPRPALFRLIPSWSGKLLGGALTFVAVVIAWVLFRADSMAQALRILQAMSGIAVRDISLDQVLHGQMLAAAGLSGRDFLRLLLPGLLWVWLLPNSTRLRFLDRHTVISLAQASLALVALYFVLDRFGSYSPFLYFQF